MSFLDHLEELRRRILYALIAVGVCAIAGFILAPKVLWLLTRPVPELVFISPQEALMVQLTVALVTGAVIAAPVVRYQVWRFVRPALTPHEARSFQPAV
ncbi:MAG: twin-arginine translocase subunit TatC, partial [candidate division WOR-3 bacterium]